MTDSVFPVPRTNNTDPTELVVRIREDAKTHRMDFAPSKVAIDLDAAADEIESLRTQIAKIRALHRLEVFSTTPYCAECHDYDGNDVAYPCRTIAALDASLAGGGKPE